MKKFFKNLKTYFYKSKIMKPIKLGVVGFL